MSCTLWWKDLRTCKLRVRRCRKAGSLQRQLHLNVEDIYRFQVCCSFPTEGVTVTFRERKSPHHERTRECSVEILSNVLPTDAFDWCMRDREATRIEPDGHQRGQKILTLGESIQEVRPIRCAVLQLQANTSAG